MPPPLKTLPPHRILVVRNDTDSGKELATQLRKMGHTVEIAYDGPSALEVEPTFRPDIVIIDLCLPGMDAFAVARSLRAQANRDVMLVAAGDSAEDHARADQAGCFTDHLCMWKSMPILAALGMKLADQSAEDWMASALHVVAKENFALRMLAAAAGRFDPAELAPLIPDEFLREIRRLAESPIELEDYMAGLKYPITFDREEILKGTSKWFRFFKP